MAGALNCLIRKTNTCSMIFSQTALHDVRTEIEALGDTSSASRASEQFLEAQHAWLTRNSTLSGVAIPCESHADAMEDIVAIQVSTDCNLQGRANRINLTVQHGLVACS